MARRILVELDVAASVSHVFIVLIIIIIFGIHWFPYTVVYFVFLWAPLLVGECSSSPHFFLGGWPARWANFC